MKTGKSSNSKSVKLEFIVCLGVLLLRLTTHAQIRELWRFEMPYEFPGNAEEGSNSWWFNSYAMAATVDGNGNTVLAGSAYDEKGGIGIFVIKLDALGGIVWKYRSGSDQLGTSYADKLLIDKKGDIYLAMRSEIPSVLGYPGISYVVTVIKLSTEGTELWRYLEPGVRMDFNGFPECIRLDTDGNLFLLVLPTNRERVICKIGTDGAVVWKKVETSKKLVDLGYPVKNSMAVTAYGGVVVVGGFDEGWPMYRTHALVQNLDANGNTIWESSDYRGNWEPSPYVNVSIGPKGRIFGGGGGLNGLTTFLPNGNAIRTLDDFGGRLVATNRSGVLVWRFGDEIGFVNAQGKLGWRLQPIQYSEVIGIVPDGQEGWLVVGHDISNRESLKVVQVDEHGRQSSAAALGNFPYLFGDYFGERNTVIRSPDGTLRLIGNTATGDSHRVMVSAIFPGEQTLIKGRADSWTSPGMRNITDRNRSGGP